MKRKYPLGHKFATMTNHITGHDGPEKWEEATVVGHWSNRTDKESGVVVQLPDGTTTEISYAYLQEDGSGH